MTADKLTAGRELNTAVAREVLGWHEWDGVGDWQGPHGVTMFTCWDAEDGALAVYPDGSDEPKSYFDPSKHIAAAWEVLERVTEPPTTLAGAWRAPNTRFMLAWQAADVWAMSTSQAAEFICRAALEAVRGET